jgi:hypothetical protein
MNDGGQEFRIRRWLVDMDATYHTATMSLVFWDRLIRKVADCGG